MSIYTEEAERRSCDCRGCQRKRGDAFKPLAPAYYIGSMMTRSGEMLRLYNLTEAVGDHPAGSTLSEETLLKLGYRLPEGR